RRPPLLASCAHLLLRPLASASHVSCFSHGRFMPVVPDDTATSSANKVLLVSGRLYYDLVDRRKKLEQEHDVAIIRVEQLYPLPAEEIATELAKYTNAKVSWVQDEPSNQGPWPFILQNLLPKLDQPVELIS